MWHLMIYHHQGQAEVVIHVMSVLRMEFFFSLLKYSAQFAVSSTVLIMRRYTVEYYKSYL